MMPRNGIDLSCGERSPEGSFLAFLIYDNMLRDEGFLGLSSRKDFYASPNNGGRHDLVLYMSAPDIFAFLDLVEEQFKNEKGCGAFIKFARQKLN
jgi:hypothetical protein